MMRALAGLLALTVSGLAVAALSPAAEQVISAWLDDQPRPVITAVRPAFSEAEAYAVQTAVNRALLKASLPEGFKAGLTSVAGQQRFGTGGPVAGVLWTGTDLSVAEGRLVLPRSRFHNPMIETELGFVVYQRITRPLESVEAVKARIKWVVPVLEFPDLYFDRPAQLRGPDIIAGNVAARYFSRGRPQIAPTIPVNEITVTLTRNGVEIGSAVSSSVMDDQWQALLWLINRTLASGWTIEPGQILITGAIGAMLPLTAGDYVADFGRLGEIRLLVE